jgi:hypothetical protein
MKIGLVDVSTSNPIFVVTILGNILKMSMTNLEYNRKILFLKEDSGGDGKIVRSVEFGVNAREANEAQS